MRIIGLDYGSRTVGIAVSDPLGLTAQGLERVTRKAENKLRRTCARIEELVRGYGASLIVLGYPLNMNDTEIKEKLYTRYIQLRNADWSDESLLKTLDEYEKEIDRGICEPRNVCGKIRHIGIKR